MEFVQASSAADYANRLRTADLRVTRPRVAVLYAVHMNPHSDTETIIRAVRACLPDVSRQAVYDILHALTQVGLLRRIQPSGLVGRYETRVGDNHHHMVCRECGAIADVDCPVGHAPCLMVGDTNGYQLDEAEVIYWGRCADCSAAAGASADRSHLTQLPDEMLCPGDAAHFSPSCGQAPTPTLNPAGTGTGGLGAGWARHDVADAAAEVLGAGTSLSFRAGTTQL